MVWIILVIIAAILFVYTARRIDLMHRPPVAKKKHVHEAPQPGQQTTPPHEEDVPPIQVPGH